MSRSLEVTLLQEELLRLLKRDLKEVDMRYERRSGNVLELRKRIQELDPDACLYEKWGGIMPTQDDRRQHR